MLYYFQRTGAGTHHKKRRSRVLKVHRKGETPITKNITVVDEHGNKYEATYPKRARGLVKHGRARFIEPNTICLACPPNIILEDKTMSNDNTPALTMEYLLGKIDQIANDTAYLEKAIAALQDLKSEPAFADNPMGDNAGAEKAEALSDVVKCRETTNQQLIALYTKMYDDIKGPAPDDRIDQVRRILGTFAEADQEKLGIMMNVGLKMLGLPTDN